MVETSAINENLRDIATIGGPVGVTVVGGFTIADWLPPLYLASVALGIVLMLVSGIYRIHKGRKDAKAHELDIRERELRIKREELEIARLQDG